MAAKKRAGGTSLSSLAAGLSTRAKTGGSVPPPRDPLVAALARKRITQGLLAKTPAPVAPVARSVAKPAARPVEKPVSRPVVTPGMRPTSQPGPSAGIPPGLKGTSKTAASVAGLVKTAQDSRAAPTKKGLTPAEHRRQYPRADLQVKAKLSLADDPSHNFEASLPTANVSVGGLFLASTFFLKLGTRLEVRLSLPPHGREVHVKAEVVRVDAKDDQGSGFALRFTDYLDGSEVVLATHFLSPVLREFIAQYAKGNGFKATPEYLSHTADVLAAWELRRAALGGDVWVVPGDRSV